MLSSLMQELYEEDIISAELRDLVIESGDINSVDAKQELTPLQLTLINGKWKTVEQLLRLGADPALRSEKLGNIALSCTSFSNDEKKLKKMISLLEDQFLTKREDYITAAYAAINYNRTKSLHVILKEIRLYSPLTSQELGEMLAAAIQENHPKILDVILSFMWKHRLTFNELEVLGLLSVAITNDNDALLLKLSETGQFATVLAKKENIDNLINLSNTHNSIKSLRVLNSIAKSQNETAKRKITFITHAPEGTLGDPSSALKIITAMKQKYGENVDIALNIVVDPEHENKVKALVGDKVPLQLSVNANLYQPEIRKRIHESDAIVLYPTPHFFQPAQIKKLKAYNVPIVAATEYDIDYDFNNNTMGRDVRIDPTISYLGTGFGKDYMGMDNMGIYLTQESMTKDRNYLTEMTDPKDIKVRDFLLRNNLEEGPPEKRELYYGYFNNLNAEHENSVVDCNFFLKLCIQDTLEHNPDKTCIDIVTPIKEQVEKNGKLDINDSIDYLNENFKDQLTINYYNKNDKGELTLVGSTGNGGLTINIINAFPLTPSGVDKLLKASNPLCLLTGDQSVSEGISNEKIFLYQTMMWKSQFLKGLIEKSKTYLGENSLLVKFYSDQLLISNFPLRENKKSKLQQQITDLIINNKEQLMLEMHILRENLLKSDNLYDKMSARIMETINTQTAINVIKHEPQELKEVSKSKLEQTSESQIDKEDKRPKSIIHTKTEILSKETEIEEIPGAKKSTRPAI